MTGGYILNYVDLNNEFQKNRMVKEKERQGRNKIL